ncbi:hypothetical protein [Stieleria varia]|uniref:Glycerophosphoryl diester phosphodiesterase membrane domain-containing protein n=1 Tax=Stieleria varia TaxID=2528005 RepID=A0A5C6B8C7_9BACT|nr:hypothetical protein [Stieleria varia]TWU08218.1 hypothetical protein Pla52n_08000 [Stieleria varia]
MSDSNNNTGCENQGDSDPKDSLQMHRGYDFESGMLSRARQWHDLLPWLQLVRSLRVCASPPLLMMVALAMVLQSLAARLSIAVRLPPPVLYGGTGAERSSNADPIPVAWAKHWLESLQSESLLMMFVQVIVTLLIWIPVVLILLRQGAVLMAGRDLESLESCLRLSWTRTWMAWVIAWVPTVCVIVLLAMLVLPLAYLSSASAPWLGTWSGVVQWPIGCVIALVGIACGVLAAGHMIASPLGWAAVVSEPDPDPLDSLSRGYEYLYRRPVHLFFYAMVSWFLCGIAYLLASAVAGSATRLLQAVGEFAGVTSAMGASNEILIFFPMVVLIALGWSIVGGVYLLLRRDAGSQDIEDIWFPPAKKRTPLPRLPETAASDDRSGSGL